MSSEKQIKVYHPTFEDVFYEVDADRVDAWTGAGWRKTPLKNGDAVAGNTDSPSKSN